MPVKQREIVRRLNEVSTAGDSDRVASSVTICDRKNETRSLTLPVLTSLSREDLLVKLNIPGNDEIGAIPRNRGDPRPLAHFAAQLFISQQPHRIFGHLVDVAYRTKEASFAVVDNFLASAHA